MAGSRATPRFQAGKPNRRELNRYPRPQGRGGVDLSKTLHARSPERELASNTTIHPLRIGGLELDHDKAIAEIPALTIAAPAGSA